MQIIELCISNMVQLSDNWYIKHPALSNTNRIITIEYFEYDRVFMTHYVNGYDISYLEPIPLTEEIMSRIPEAKHNPINIVIDSWQIELGRNRRFSVTVESGNQYIWLEEYDEKDYRKINDIACVFNGDYDGKLTVHKLQNLYFVLSGKEIEVNVGHSK